jgi:hypothetical protein
VANFQVSALAPTGYDAKAYALNLFPRRCQAPPAVGKSERRAEGSQSGEPRGRPRPCAGGLPVPRPGVDSILQPAGPAQPGDGLTLDPGNGPQAALPTDREGALRLAVHDAAPQRQTAKTT